MVKGEFLKQKLGVMNELVDEILGSVLGPTLCPFLDKDNWGIFMGGFFCFVVGEN